MNDVFIPGIGTVSANVSKPANTNVQSLYETKTLNGRTYKKRKLAGAQWVDTQTNDIVDLSSGTAKIITKAADRVGTGFNTLNPIIYIQNGKGYNAKPKSGEYETTTFDEARQALGDKLGWDVKDSNISSRKALVSVSNNGLHAREAAEAEEAKNYEIVTGSDDRVYKRKRGTHGLFTDQYGNEYDLSDKSRGAKIVNYSGRISANGKYFVGADYIIAARDKRGFKVDDSVLNTYGKSTSAWVETDDNGDIVRMIAAGAQERDADGNIYQYNADGTKKLVYDRRKNVVSKGANAETKKEAKQSKKYFTDIQFDSKDANHVDLSFNSFYEKNKDNLWNALYNSPEGSVYLQQWRDKGIDPSDPKYNQEILQNWIVSTYNHLGNKYKEQYADRIKKGELPDFHEVNGVDIFTDVTTANKAYTAQKERENALRQVQARDRVHRSVSDVLNNKPYEDKDYHEYSTQELSDMNTAWRQSMYDIDSYGQMSPYVLAAGAVALPKIAATATALSGWGSSLAAGKALLTRYASMYGRKAAAKLLGNAVGKSTAKFVGLRVLPSFGAQMGTNYALGYTDLSDENRRFLSGLAGFMAGNIYKGNVFDFFKSGADYALFDKVYFPLAQSATGDNGMGTMLLASALSGVGTATTNSLGTKATAKVGTITKDWGQKASAILKQKAKNGTFGAKAAYSFVNPDMRFRYYTTPMLRRMNQGEALAIGTPFWQTENKLQGAVNNGASLLVSGAAQAWKHTKGALPVIGASAILDPTLGSAMEKAGYGDLYDNAKMWSLIGASKAVAKTTNIGKWLHENSGGASDVSKFIDQFKSGKNWRRALHTGAFFNNYNGTLVQNLSSARRFEGQRASDSSGYGSGWLRKMYGDGVLDGNLRGEIEVFRGLEAPTSMQNSNYAQAYKFLSKFSPDQLSARRGLGQSITFVAPQGTKSLRAFINDLNKGYEHGSVETLNKSIDAYNKEVSELRNEFDANATLLWKEGNSSIVRRWLEKEKVNFKKRWKKKNEGLPAEEYWDKKTKKAFEEAWKKEKTTKRVQNKFVTDIGTQAMIKQAKLRFQDAWKNNNATIKNRFYEEGEIGRDLFAMARLNIANSDKLFTVSEQGLNTLYEKYKGKYERKAIRDALNRINKWGLQEILAQAPKYKNHVSKYGQEVRGDIVIGKVILEDGTVRYEYWNGDGHNHLVSNSGKQYYMDVTGTGSAGMKHAHDDAPNKKTTKEAKEVKEEAAPVWWKKAGRAVWNKAFKPVLKPVADVVTPPLVSAAKTLLDQSTTHSLPILLTEIDMPATRRSGITPTQHNGIFDAAHNNSIAVGVMNAAPVNYTRRHDIHPWTWRETFREWLHAAGWDSYSNGGKIKYFY